MLLYVNNHNVTLSKFLEIRISPKNFIFRKISYVHLFLPPRHEFPFWPFNDTYIDPLTTPYMDDQKKIRFGSNFRPMLVV